MLRHRGQRAAFDFYVGYLSVVYGLLVTKGLEYALNFTADGGQKLGAANILLFVGGFLAALHFWYVCATVDNVSSDFYCTVAGVNLQVFDIFVLVDVVVATLLAALIMAMFDAIPNTKYFLWFVIAAALSLAYDLYSLRLIAVARGCRSDVHSRAVIADYREVVNGWIVGDSIFLVSAAVLYILNRQNALAPAPLSCLVVLVMIAMLALDVWSGEGSKRFTVTSQTDSANMSAG